MLDYFYEQDADVFTFYRIPKELFTHHKYKHVCSEAKFLYGLLLDHCSHEEVVEVFREEKADKLFNELRKADLIEEAGQEGKNI